MGSVELVAAVRRGDADAVRGLLDDGGDPEHRDPADGVPLLCLAVAAYDEPVAEALLDAGADPLRPLDGVPGGDPGLPGGDTALTRAVDGGSSTMTGRLLPEPVLLDADARAALLARARYWAEADIEAELRRSTGADGPVERRRVWEEPLRASCYESFSLGGRTVWDGHLGVLTVLEERFRMPVPFDELLARALTRPDRDHGVWTDVVIRLAGCLGAEDWAAAEALRDHPDRLRRLFAADVLRCLVIGFGGMFPRSSTVVEKEASEVFLPWAREERDPEVLAQVLSGLSEESGGSDRSDEIDAVGLSYVGHPDPRVRREAVETLRYELTAMPRDKLDAVFALARDPDPAVRERAVYWLAHCRGEAPGLTDVLAGLGDDELRKTRVHAARGLALRGDPRCAEAARRLRPLDAERWPDADLVDAMWRYERGEVKGSGRV
ncbi:HEAT repeat domain-containing protein [Streptomyces sp. NPDC002623]